MIYDLTPEEAQVIDRLREYSALCVCGHKNSDHDGGVIGFWCDGSGTHGTAWAYLNEEKLCKCKAFRHQEEPKQPKTP